MHTYTKTQHVIFYELHILHFRDEREENLRKMSTLESDVASLYEKLTVINEEREATEVAGQHSKEQIAKVRCMCVQALSGGIGQSQCVGG